MPSSAITPPASDEIKFIGGYTRGVAADPFGATLTVKKGVVFQIDRLEADGFPGDVAASAIVQVVTAGAEELYRASCDFDGSTFVMTNAQRGLSATIGPFSSDTVVQIATSAIVSTSGTPVCAARAWLRQAIRNSAG